MGQFGDDGYTMLAFLNQPTTGVVTMGLSRDSAPRFRAGMAGVFCMLMFLSGGVATVARRGIVVSGDAAATATNIMAHQSAYLVAFAGELLVVATCVAVVALFYRMFKPVNRSVSLIAAFCGLTGCAIQGAASLFLLAPLSVLGGAKYLDVFSVQQLQALAYMFLRLYNQAYGIAIVLFGFFCVLTGYLTFKSTFLPRILGVLIAFAGLSWLTFLAPLFAARYFAYILPTAAGEGLLYLWLLVKGVDAERWNQQADAGGRG
jgi:hypothetical protein